MTCQHPYKFPASEPGTFFCTTCKVIIRDEPKEKKDLIVPPNILSITPTSWKHYRPWPRMPFEVADKYGWYMSYLSGGWYLIMPVFRGRKMVFYSARRIDTLYGNMGTYADSRFVPRKYLNPEGVDKRAWINLKNDGLVVLTEGLADAAYVSQIYSSAALFGSHYLDELEELIPPTRTRVIMMDGDLMGHVASVDVQASMAAFKHTSKVAVLPAGKDPTDLTLPELNAVITKAIYK